MHQCISSILLLQLAEVELVYTLRYVRYFSSVVPNLWPSKGHKINLMNHEMINGRGKKEKQTYATQICIHFLAFSLAFSFL